MSFSGNFSIQPDLTDPSSFSLTDTSVGSDTNLTGRQVFLYNSTSGTLNYPDATTPYISWPISEGIGDVLQITGLLTQDYSLNILVSWISSDPISGSTYTKYVLYTFTGNSNQFINQMVQELAANPAYLDSYNFMGSLGNVQTNLDSALNAQEYNQQYSAQFALNRIQFYITNQQLFFA